MGRAPIAILCRQWTVLPEGDPSRGARKSMRQQTSRRERPHRSNHDVRSHIVQVAREREQEKPRSLRTESNMPGSRWTRVPRFRYITRCNNINGEASAYELLRQGYIDDFGPPMPIFGTASVMKPRPLDSGAAVLGEVNEPPT